jgi:non-ribosomal peptide synthetase component F
MLLAKISEETDVIVGTDLVGRERPELTGVVGTFVNVLPLRLRVDPEGTYADLLREVKECVLEAVDNQAFQHDQIVAALGKEGKSARKLFDVHFSFANYLDPGADLSELNLVPVPLDAFQTTQYEFKLEAREKPGGLDIDFIYSKALYTGDTIGLLVNYYRNLLKGALHNPGAAVGSIELADTALANYNFS